MGKGSFVDKNLLRFHKCEKDRFLSRVFMVQVNYFTIVQLLLLSLYTRLKAVISRCEDVAREQNTRYHLARTIGNGEGIPCTRCVFHTGYPGHENRWMK